MAELTKQALQVENNTSFPNNNAGLITPTALRTFNSDMIDSLVDEISYTADSASFNSRINNVTGSATNTGSLLLTASFDNGTRNLTFTKGDASTFNVNIPDASGSAGDFVTTSSFNAYTASTDSSISQLNASSASQQTSINALNAATSSYVTSAITASSLVTASFSGNTLTFTKGDASTFGVVIPDVSGSTINTGSFATTASFNAYTQSNDQRVSSLEANSGSVNTSITNINSATSSLFTSASLGLTTASFSGNTLTFTKGDASTFGVIIPDISGSTIDTGSFATTGSNTFTGVNTFNERTNLQGINVYTGSASGIYIGDRTNFAPTTAGNIPGNQHTVVGQGALNSFGNGDLNAAFGPSALFLLISGSSNLAMGGFAGYALVNGNTNTFIGDQAGNGMKGGDNNFFLGSSAGNNFRTGSFNIMIGLNTQGNLATGSGNLFIGYQTGGKIANNVDNQFSVAYGTDITPRKLFFKSGSEADNLGLYGGLEIENTLTASLAEGFALVGGAGNRTIAVATSSFGGGTINTGSFATTGSNTFTGNQTISTAGNTQLNLIAQPGFQTNVEFQSENSNFRAYGDFNINNNGQYGGSGSIKMLVKDNNIILAADRGFQLGQTNGIGNGIGTGPVTINVPTGSSTMYLTGSLNVTNAFSASLPQGYVWVGDGSNITALVATSSFGSTINTGSFATTGSNSFVGNQTITGNVTISGSATSDLTVVGQIFVSSSATGGTTAPKITVSGSAGRSVINRNSISTFNTTDEGGMFPSTFYTKDAATADEIGFTVDPSVFSISGWSTGPAIYVNNDALDTYPAVIGFQNKANYTDGRITALKPLVVSGSLNVSGSSSFTGSLTIQSGSAFFANGNKQFNVGAFSSLVSQSGSANVSQSMNFEVTDISQGVSIVSNSRITLANSGTYNIQFSAQVDRVSGSGTDTVHIWLKKNGTNVSASAGAITVSGGASAAKTISSWNYVVDASAGDYYEIVWQPTDANLELIAAAATGNIPSIPSVILTVTQVR